MAVPHEKSTTDQRPLIRVGSYHAAPGVRSFGSATTASSFPGSDTGFGPRITFTPSGLAVHEVFECVTRIGSR